MGSKISILGAGWLGSRLAKQFAEQGNSVQLATRSMARLNNLNIAKVPLYQVDIEALTDNIDDFLNAQILIINITCKNVMAFKALLKKIEAAPIEKVIFISSTSVYPAQHSLCLESDSLEISSHPLLQIEKLLTDSAQLQTTIVRFAGLIGPKRHPGRFFSAGKKLRDPQARVNLIHLDDCLAIINSIIARQAWGEVFNACADSHPSKKEYYSQSALSLGLSAPEFLDAQTASKKVVSNNKLKALLDYQFIYPDLEQICW